MSDAECQWKWERPPSDPGTPRTGLLTVRVLPDSIEFCTMCCYKDPLTNYVIDEKGVGWSIDDMGLILSVCCVICGD